MKEPGLEFTALATGLGLVSEPELPEGAPSDGWRVLDSVQGAARIVGAPTDATGQFWRVAFISQGSEDSPAPSLTLHPQAFPLRPSPRSRAEALTLRWPEVTRSEPNLSQLVIDIVNAGDRRWYPRGDSFMVFAGFQQPGATASSVSFGYVSGQTPAMPLDPGEYARVRVHIDSSQWPTLRPGPYIVDPILIDLGLRATDRLELEITEDDIQRHTPASRLRRDPPPG